MKPILYLEGACGISGDMTVAALLGLGARMEVLDKVLDSLHLDGFRYTVTAQKSYGIAGNNFDVTLSHDEGHHHHTEHHDCEGHNHHEHAHVHEHRNLADVNAVIDRGEMSDRARTLAKKIFRIVAEAEAKAHGCPIEEVHFHEVGAIDSIVDIVAASVLIDDLQIQDCVVTGLHEGSGFVNCQHGALPVPVPAVLNIAECFGIPLLPTEGINGEMVTPTGIAIAAALRTRDTLPRRYLVRKTGIGLGKRDFGRANFLRAMLLEEIVDPEQIYVIETNLDDTTGEALGLSMDELFKAGARDVHFMPCFMKKNRPAYLLRVIADASHLPVLEETIFRTTTTIGLRKYPVERTCMDREIVEIKLSMGTVKFKRCTLGNVIRHYPEYESVKALAEKCGMDFQTVFQAAREEGERRNG